MKPPKKKQSRGQKRARAHKRKLTKNPLFTLVNPPDFPIPAGTTLPVEIVDTPFGFGADMENMAADLIVRLLAECSPAEKVLIAALIPEFLKVVRPKKTTPPPTEAP